MKIIIGSDHAGFEYKKLLIQHFDSNKISFEDCGTHNNDPTDYPDYAHMVSQKVSHKVMVGFAFEFLIDRETLL